MCSANRRERTLHGDCRATPRTKRLNSKGKEEYELKYIVNIIPVAVFRTVPINYFLTVAGDPDPPGSAVYLHLDLCSPTF